MPYPLEVIPMATTNRKEDHSHMRQRAILPRQAVAELLAAMEEAPGVRYAGKGYGVAVIESPSLLSLLSEEYKRKTGKALDMSGLPLLFLYRTPEVSRRLVSLDSGEVASAILRTAANWNLHARISYQLPRLIDSRWDFWKALRLGEGTVPVLAAALSAKDNSGAAEKSAPVFSVGYYA